MKTSHQSPALLINEMSKAGGQCQKNPGAGNDQVACEKYAAECTLDEGPLDTMSSQYATGSTNIDEPNVKVSPDDVSSDWVSRGMDTRKGCGKRTAKSVETHTDSNSAATIDDDDIYSGSVESSSDERRDINEVTASNHHQATNPALHTKNTTGGSDPVDIQTKAQVTQADTTPGKETRSTTQVDSHKSREPWHTWTKDRKQQRKLMRRRNLGNALQPRILFSTLAFKSWTSIMQIELDKSIWFSVYGSLNTFLSEYRYL